MRHKLVAVVIIAALFANFAAHADAQKGNQIAQQRCAGCHPSFRAVAKRGMSEDQLRVVLSHPHFGIAPLSSAEINDLIVYIESLR
jgi:mono/diheme cytochrome c family protein